MYRKFILTLVLSAGEATIDEGSARDGRDEATPKAVYGAESVCDVCIDEFS